MALTKFIKESLSGYKQDMQDELTSILNFWIHNTVDKLNGGFYGRLDNSNKVHHQAPKEAVLNSRILWAFSAAYNLGGDVQYLDAADGAFTYLTDHFIDRKYGGIFWTVDHNGKPLDTKKQFYALSFAIYGLSEYHKCNNYHEAKTLAIELYHSIITNSYDLEYGGYIEALSRDWQFIDDLRLSNKDANEKKSMNTHLHILEGFANLYLIWPNKSLKHKIEELIEIFFEHIIDHNNHHLILFFDEKWNPRSNIFSYGHDIEAAWLINEAAGIINNKRLIRRAKTASVKLVTAAAEGLDKDGGLWYEYEERDDHLIKEKHSWPQAESIIGFLNAWQTTGNKHFLEKSIASWQFLKTYILDKKNKEWLWGVRENYEVMDEDKVGIWKCPYHNSRACIEIIKRIDKIQREQRVEKPEKVF